METGKAKIFKMKVYISSNLTILDIKIKNSTNKYGCIKLASTVEAIKTKSI